MTIDHAAVAPLYALAGGAVLALLAGLFAPRSRLPVLAGVLSAGVAASLAVAVATTKGRDTFCASAEACAYRSGYVTVAVIVAACGLTALVLLLDPSASGEYVFAMLASVLGLAVLVGAGDLLTLIVAVETLTLPTYLLVSLAGTRRAASGAMTMFVISVVSSAIGLFGVALLYTSAGSLYFAEIPRSLTGLDSQLRPLLVVGTVLLIGGLLFKVAAVPFHAWAPAAYDGARPAVAGYLATVAKLGGFVAVALAMTAMRGALDVVAVVIAVVAVASMSVGNVMALRQRRVLRLFGWSSVAQLGFALAPLGVLASSDDSRAVVAAGFGYLGFYLPVVLSVFAAIALATPVPRTLAELRGLGRSQPLLAVPLLLGLIGLAGLPPGFAGLWAKIASVRGVVTGDGWTKWLLVAALVVNIVIGLAVYLRVVRELFTAPDDESESSVPALTRGRAVGLVLLSVAVLAVGLAPEPIFVSADKISAALLACCG